MLWAANTTFNTLNKLRKIFILGFLITISIKVNSEIFTMIFLRLTNPKVPMQNPSGLWAPPLLSFLQQSLPYLQFLQDFSLFGLIMITVCPFASCLPFPFPFPFEPYMLFFPFKPLFGLFTYMNKLNSQFRVR